LDRFLQAHSELVVAVHPDLAMLADSARAAVLVGGKRLRPTFAYWGWRSVQPAGADGEADLIEAAASLELLHACALVHDDVMDSSDTRRGQPAAHVRFAAEHAAQGWTGPAATFGTAGAILLGDLLLSWAEEMFTGAIAGLPAERRAASVREFDLMRTEVVAGQFLDVLAQTRGDFDPAEALRVIEYKTSKYTIQRPLLLGAAAAGAGERGLATLAGYGHALGEAFQLRDDLLGVFGDPSQTGKPAGDDLREGKRTLLVALAAERADEATLAMLRADVGRADLDAAGVRRLQAVLIETGARDAVEERIAERAAAASAEVTGGELDDEARAALLDLADAAAHRSF
jgi:geranylgeranyl diphosphate synthase type I